MTRRRMLVLSAVTLLVAAASGRARGEVRRETTARRPYIVEIGEPYEINTKTLHRESERINDLKEYMTIYGHADYAEVQEIAPTWPWESHEVRLYYLKRNFEVAFGRVLMSPAVPDLGVLKFQGDIPPEKRHQIEVILQARHAPPAAAPAPVVSMPEEMAPLAEQPRASGLTEALVARIEAAAERAAQAADRAAKQSEGAARAADRTVGIVEKMTESAALRRR